MHLTCICNACKYSICAFLALKWSQRHELVQTKRAPKIGRPNLGSRNNTGLSLHFGSRIFLPSEILSRIAQTTAALSRLKIIWRDKNISLASKVKLMWTLILSTFLYACESWTLTAEIERRIQALEMRCYRRLLNISYKDHVTNEEVRNRIQNAIGVHDDLLTMVKKRKLR